MTVEGLIGDDEEKALCVWFSVKGAMEPRDTTDLLPIFEPMPFRATFPAGALTRIEPVSAG